MAEAKGFRDRILDFEKRNAVILGISTDLPSDNLAFREELKLPFPLLSDVGRRVCLAYGACAFESSYYADRMTFIIDANGIIRKVYSRVNIPAHIPEILDFLDHSWNYES